MPSKAFQDLRKNIQEAERMEQTYELLSRWQEKKGKQGKRSYGHITKSGVLLLCAAWEVYVEDLSREVLKHSFRGKKGVADMHPNFLKHVRERVSEYFSGKPHLPIKDERALFLYDNDFRENSVAMLEEYLERFNTPNTGNVETLFSKFVGVKFKKDFWAMNGELALVDRFISRRGEIAHSGAKARYPKKSEFDGYIELVKNAAQELDDLLLAHMKKETGVKPWGRRATWR